ncbi:MAG: hypothetical protein OEW42_09195 [Acidimicrobiia bacterium]|nr:hypothetical protein [Acidimicrobiia bacterium]MDH5238941.1 hypothetical protein [Acidimicrobiia bacterium]
MSLRDLAAGAARTGAGIWQGVADAIEPAVDASTAPAKPVVVPAPGQEPTRADALVSSGEAMLVPIDSWTRIVDQMANLHEAGQQLAEARERAAKAETEAAFLRAQLAEAKKRRRSGPSPAPAGEGSASPGTGPLRRSALGLADRARRRARGWIGS